MIDYKTAGASVVVAVALMFVFGIGQDGADGRNGRDGVGAFAGPTISSDYLDINGVRHHYRHASIRTGTTTVCVLKGPPATSTLAYYSAKIDNEADSSITEGAYKVFDSNNDSATTTQLVGFDGGVADGVHIFATTTNDNFQMEPNRWVVLDVSAASSTWGTGNTSGGCNAVFIEQG